MKTKQKKVTISYGIQVCSKCKYFLRCEECVYNEKDIKKLIEDAKQETAREILQELTSKGTIHAEYDWNEYFEIDVDELKKLAKSRGIEFGG